MLFLVALGATLVAWRHVSPARHRRGRRGKWKSGGGVGEGESRKLLLPETRPRIFLIYSPFF